MSFGAGRSGVFKVDVVGGTLTDISTYCSKVDATFSVTLGDTTVFGASGETSIPTIKNGDKITFSGYLDPTVHTQLGALYGAFGGLTAGGSISFEYGPMGSTTGNPKFTGESWLSSYKVSVDVKGVVAFDGELTITNGATSTVY